MTDFFNVFVPPPGGLPDAEAWPPPTPPRRKAEVDAAVAAQPEAVARITVPVAPVKPAGPVSYGMALPRGNLRALTNPKPLARARRA